MRELAFTLVSRDGDRAPVFAPRGLLQRHLLEPAAVGAARFETEGSELAGDVARGDLVPARAGVTTFEQVVREERHVRAEMFGSECRRSELVERRLGERGLGERESGGEDSRDQGN